ncbi:MAG: C40 family peptidase [Actinomycetaceae bacterium]|nr:C40 family peptidase [Actinomycetaceae bacterium]
MVNIRRSSSHSYTAGHFSQITISTRNQRLLSNGGNTHSDRPGPAEKDGHRGHVNATQSPGAGEDRPRHDISARGGRTSSRQQSDVGGRDAAGGVSAQRRRQTEYQMPFGKEEERGRDSTPSTSLQLGLRSTRDSLRSQHIAPPVRPGFGNAPLSASRKYGRTRGSFGTRLTRTVIHSARSGFRRVIRAPQSVWASLSAPRWRLLIVPALVILLILAFLPGWIVDIIAKRSAITLGGSCHGAVAVPENARPWVSEMAHSSHLDPGFIARMMYRESKFDPEVFAPDDNGGTWGLIQINRRIWATVYPGESAFGSGTPKGITDPMAHAKYGGLYLKNALEEVRALRSANPEAPYAKISEEEALVIEHNAGRTALMRYPHIPSLTKNYIEEVVHGKSPSSAQCGPTLSGSGAPVVAEAQKYLGVDYVWGGESLAEGGLDCSGLVQLSYSNLGVSLPRTADEQARVGQEIASGPGTSVDLSLLKPGDVIAFRVPGVSRYHHIGIYVGDGQMIHAPTTGDVVRYAPLAGFWASEEWAVRRFEGRG